MRIFDKMSREELLDYIEFLQDSLSVVESRLMETEEIVMYGKSSDVKGLKDELHSYLTSGGVS